MKSRNDCSTSLIQTQVVTSTPVLPLQINEPKGKLQAIDEVHDKISVINHACNEEITICQRDIAEDDKKLSIAQGMTESTDGKTLVQWLNPKVLGSHLQSTTMFTQLKNFKIRFKQEKELKRNDK